MARAMRVLMPCAEVAAVPVQRLEVEVRRLNFHFLARARPVTFVPGGRAAWARLSDDPDEPSEFCLGGRRKRSENPGFDELLAIVDETEEIVRSGRDLAGC